MLPYCDVIAVDHVFRVEASFSQLAVLLIMAVDRAGNAYSVATGIVSNKSANMTTAVMHELVKALRAKGVVWKPKYLLHDLCQTDFIGVKAAMPTLEKSIYCYWHRIAAAATEVKKRVTKVIDAALNKHEITTTQALELQRNSVFAQLVACWSTTEKDAAAAAVVSVCKYALEFPELASWLKSRYQDEWDGAFNCLRDFEGAHHWWCWRGTGCRTQHVDCWRRQHECSGCFPHRPLSWPCQLCSFAAAGPIDCRTGRSRRRGSRRAAAENCCCLGRSGSGIEWSRCSIK